MGKTRKDEQRQTNLNSNPDNEVLTERKRLKSRRISEKYAVYCGFANFEKRSKIYLCIKLTSNGA